MAAVHASGAGAGSGGRVGLAAKTAEVTRSKMIRPKDLSVFMIMRAFLYMQVVSLPESESERCRAMDFI